MHISLWKCHLVAGSFIKVFFHDGFSILQQAIAEEWKNSLNSAWVQIGWWTVMSFYEKKEVNITSVFNLRGSKPFQQRESDIYKQS